MEFICPQDSGQQIWLSYSSFCSRLSPQKGESSTDFKVLSTKYQISVDMPQQLLFLCLNNSESSSSSPSSLFRVDGPRCSSSQFDIPNIQSTNYRPLECRCKLLRNKKYSFDHNNICVLRASSEKYSRSENNYPRSLSDGIDR